MFAISKDHSHKAEASFFLITLLINFLMSVEDVLLDFNEYFSLTIANLDLTSTNTNAEKKSSKMADRGYLKRFALQAGAGPDRELLTPHEVRDTNSPSGKRLV